MKACTILLLLAVSVSLVAAAPAAPQDIQKVCKAGTVSVNDVIRIAAEAEVTRKEMSAMKSSMAKCQKKENSVSADSVSLSLDQVGVMQKQMMTDIKRLFELMSTQKKTTQDGGTPNVIFPGDTGSSAREIATGGQCFTPETTCFTGYGHYYRGTVSVTESGKTCQRWDGQTPHSHDRTIRNYPNDDLRENYCRNPDFERKPWCYTTDRNKRFEHCNIPMC